MQKNAPGKDKPYCESIQSLQTALFKAGFNIVQKPFLNPVPGIFSCCIYDADCPQCYANGKGTTKEQALASAYGEFCERLSLNHFFCDYYFGKTIAAGEFAHYPNERWLRLKPQDSSSGQLLNPELLAFYNPTGELTEELLVDFNTGNGARGICCLPFQRLKDKALTYFPLNLLDNLYVSNGMASGNSQAEARVQAICEIIERYVKFKVIAERLTCPNVPTDVMQRFPRFSAIVRDLNERGFEVLVKDASLSGKFPVVNATLIDKKNCRVLAAFGAHPAFEIACERALTELLQGRDLGKLEDLKPPTFDCDELVSSQNLEEHFIDSTGYIHWDFFNEKPSFDFSWWNFEGDTASQFRFLTKLIHNMSKEVYIADYNHFGIYCCRIIIPTISEIYPVSDLILENKTQALPLRDPILNLQKLGVSGYKALYDEILDLGFHREQNVAALIGLLPDKGSIWGQMNIGQLCAILAAATGNFDDATMWSNWCCSDENPDTSHKSLFHCLYTVLKFKYGLEERQPWEQKLKHFFSDDVIGICQSLITGKMPISEVFLTDLGGSDSHSKLLKAYEKCQILKKR